MSNGIISKHLEIKTYYTCIILCMKSYIVIKCMNRGIEHNSAKSSCHKFCSNKCQKEFEFKKILRNGLMKK